MTAWEKYDNSKELIITNLQLYVQYMYIVYVFGFIIFTEKNHEPWKWGQIEMFMFDKYNCSIICIIFISL